jgi:hypothetical protein
MPKTDKPKQQSPGKAKAKNQPNRPRKQGVRARVQDAPAARASHATNVGMDDLRAHRISWLAGTTYVGDGTLGIADQVYFRPAGQTTNVVPGNTGSGMVPILAADTRIGQTYVSDIEKHYSRKVIRSLKLRLISLVPSTANSAMVYIGPVRGPGAAGDCITVTTATAAPTIANTLGMSNVQSAASWEHRTLDLTPYVAGGSGAKQNEFAISRNGDDVSTAWGDGNQDLTGVAPCAFVISGTCATAALRASNLHFVVIEQVCDFLDFIGGNALSVPLSFSAVRRFLGTLEGGKSLSDCDAQDILRMVERSFAARSTRTIPF